jgi:hypothetical protein
LTWISSVTPRLGINELLQGGIGLCRHALHHTSTHALLSRSVERGVGRPVRAHWH